MKENCWNCPEKREDHWYLWKLVRVSIGCRRTKPKQLLWPIKKDGGNSVNQSKLEVITRSRHKARENVHARATIGFGFTSDWLKKWGENFEPITEWSNHKPKQFANYFRHSIENRSIVVLWTIALTIYLVNTLPQLVWRSHKDSTDKRDGLPLQWLEQINEQKLLTMNCIPHLNTIWPFNGFQLRKFRFFCHQI